jgi:hypothetical protein
MYQTPQTSMGEEAYQGASTSSNEVFYWFIFEDGNTETAHTHMIAVSSC